MAYDIGPKIGIEGEVEFRNAIKQINENMKTLGTEMKVVASQFDKNDTSVEAITAKNEVLNKEIEEQNKKLSELTKGLEAAKEKYGDMDGVTQGWQRAVNSATADLNSMERELKSNNESLEKTKNVVNDASDEMKTLGNNADDVGTEMKDIGNKVNDAGDDIKKLGNNADDAGKKCLSMGDIIKANLISDAIISGIRSLANSIKSIASDALSSADSIQQLADQTNLTAEKVQELSYVGNTLGVDTDTITGSFSKLINNMSSATKGTGTAYDAFEKLGISITDTNGNLRDNQTVWQETITALGNVKNETERTAIAQDIFGRSASDLNPLISAGAEQLASLAKQANETGAVMSNDTVSSLDDFGDTMDQLKSSATGMAGTFLAELLPSLKDVIKELKENAPEIKETIKGVADKVGDVIKFLVDNGPAIIATLGGIAAGLMAWNVVTMIQGVVGAIKAFQLANEGATVAQWALNAAMNANPIGIIIALISALVAGIVILWNTNEGFRNAVISIFKGIGSAFKTLVNGIIGFFTGTIPDAINGFLNLFKSVPSKVKTIGSNIVKGVKDGMAGIANIGKNLVNGIWNGIDDETEWIVNKVKGFSDSVLDSIKGFFGIHSPSTVFRDEVGKYLAQGIGEGFSVEMDSVTNKMNSSIPTSFDVASTYNAKSLSGQTFGATGKSGDKITNYKVIINNPKAETSSDSTRKTLMKLSYGMG